LQAITALVGFCLRRADVESWNADGTMNQPERAERNNNKRELAMSFHD